jgi:hypothetical protein
MIKAKVMLKERKTSSRREGIGMIINNRIVTTAMVM